LKPPQESLLLGGRLLCRLHACRVQLLPRFILGPAHLLVESIELLAAGALNFIVNAAAVVSAASAKSARARSNDSRTTSSICVCACPTKLRLVWSSSLAKTPETSPAFSRNWFSGVLDGPFRQILNLRLRFLFVPLSGFEQLSTI